MPLAIVEIQDETGKNHTIRTLPLVAVIPDEENMVAVHKIEFGGGAIELWPPVLLRADQKLVISMTPSPNHVATSVVPG